MWNVGRKREESKATKTKRTGRDEKAGKAKEEKKKRKTKESKQRTKEKSCILGVPNPAQSKLTKVIWVKPVKPLQTFKEIQTDSP